jgi:hypothetical protein
MRYTKTIFVVLLTLFVSVCVSTFLPKRNKRRKE